MKTIHHIKPVAATLFGAVCSFIAVFSLQAQQKVSDIKAVVRDVYQQRDSVRVVLDVEIAGASVSAREQAYIFPVIRSGSHERRMAPIVISGKTQQAVIKRAEKLSGNAENVYVGLKATARKPLDEKVSYIAAVPLESWMKGANVALAHELRNCRGEFHRVSMEIVSDSIRFIPKPRRPEYDLPVRIPVPPREEIKNRTETGQAYIIYKVGSADIDAAMANNREELDKISKSIEDIRGVEGVKINSIMISAYASPEGTWQSNLNLSERRASSLTGWLRRNYSLGGIALSSRGYGEDWKGLEELVEKDASMTPDEKEAALGMIGNTTDFDEREKLLRQYNNGLTYRHLLSSLYPQLRRSVYTIKYTVPEYSMESIKKVFKTNPKMLSLHEFYLLANQYEPGSADFNSVVRGAVSVYPTERLSLITAAAFSIISGDTTMARHYLEGLEDDPDAWIYLSAVHAKEGDLEKAAFYARKAEHAGNNDAALHLKMIGEYRETDTKYKKDLQEWEQYGIE